ncbi:MAG: hypothetical protein ACLU37_09920 [Collinsella sp.]
MIRSDCLDHQGHDRNPDRRKLQDGRKVTVSNAAATVGNSTAGLLEGDELTVEQALRGLMIPSGNDAAIVLAEYGQEDRPQDQRRRGNLCEGHERARQKAPAAPARSSRTHTAWTLMSGPATCTQPHMT